MADWREYNGSDEQIAELTDAYAFIVRSLDIGEISAIEENNYIFKFNRDFENEGSLKEYLGEFLTQAMYWIIPEDPLRSMKIRQAETGQPVWIRQPSIIHDGEWYNLEPTDTPDWKIPGAEYSFTPFEEICHV